MLRFLNVQLISGVGLVLLLSGCSDSIKNSVTASPAALKGEARDELLLHPHTRVPVDPEYANGMIPFHVLTREPRIQHFPCSTCHQDPESPQPAQGTPHENGHPDIVLAHAGGKAMDCATCHQTDTPDQLIALNKEPVSFDHAYQVCASCHFQQVDDWAGGAHGKRMAGWRGERVVMNCTECHNPHAPTFEQRWPAKTPRIPRKPTAL